MIDEKTEVSPSLSPKEARMADHLASIDPVLIPFAKKLASPPFKDLSTPERIIREEDALEPSDLVAVHLTNTLPENGIIHPMGFYDPQTLRFTTHYTINSLAPRIPLYGWNWEDRKYAVLIPFQNLKDRVLAFNPGDTFVIEDLMLPEGTVILTDQDIPSDTNLGNAQIVKADFSQSGEKINGFQRAVYEQMINMGYFPQDVSPRGEWMGWGISQLYGLRNRQTYAGLEMWREFCKENGLEFAGGGSPHESHWTGQLENFAFWLNDYIKEKDEQGLEDLKEGSKEFLTTTDMPEKYKQALEELLADTKI